MNNLQANLCLIAVTLCWSCEVVIFSVIPADVNPFATTCVTSLIGAAIVGACFARRIKAAFQRDRWLLARRLLSLSLMNTSYNVLNLIGLDYFDVSTGAFTLSMTVVVLPVLLLVMRRGVGARTWISAGCVLVGIAIAVFPTVSFPQLPGLLIMLAGCIIRALYIVKLNDYAHEHDPVALAAGISGINAVIAFVPWCAMQPATFTALPWSPELISAYVIYAYFIVGFATVINIFAQRRATAAQSTIIYSTEIVFSTIWACCLPASIVEPVNLTFSIVAGCALVVAGNLVEIVRFKPREEAEGPQNAALSTSETQAVEQQANLAPEREGAVRDENILSDLLDRMKRPIVRATVLFAVLLGAYLAFALPFKVISVIPGFTDIRPVEMLVPVYGIFFGIPGCFACAVGNLIGDIMSDSLRWSSIAGFISNFAHPYLMYLFWCELRKKPFELRHARTLALMAIVVVVTAVIQVFIIAPAIAIAYPDVDLWLFAISVTANGTAFPLCFAIPFMILLHEELGFKPQRA